MQAKNSTNIELSIILPSYNEQANLAILIPSIQDKLSTVGIEIIVVDDNSPDGTAEYVRKLAQNQGNIRILHRYGRRGLSSAVVEGIMASSGDYIAVMDADLQHDENKLVDMLEMINNNNIDIIIASRFIQNNPTLGLSKKRQKLSNLANTMCNLMLPKKLSDPMTGFFMLKRSVFYQSLPHLSPMGFKILFDILVSYPNKNLVISEIPFNFRKRTLGISKLGTAVIWDFCIYIAEYLLGKKVPGAFISFCIIGGIGVIFHIALLYALLTYNIPFIASHITATACTISINFFLNNSLTYSYGNLSGIKMLIGLSKFYIICGLGAFANVGLAAYIYQFQSAIWLLPAIAGIVVGSFWNFAMSRYFTWSNADKKVY